MEKTYYKILKAYTKKGVHYTEFEFSDDPEGFFLPVTVEADSEEEMISKLNDFLGANSQEIK